MATVKNAFINETKIADLRTLAILISGKEHSVCHLNQMRTTKDTSVSSVKNFSALGFVGSHRRSKRLRSVGGSKRIHIGSKDSPERFADVEIQIAALW